MDEIKDNLTGHGNGQQLRTVLGLGQAHAEAGLIVRGQAQVFLELLYGRALHQHWLNCPCMQLQILDLCLQHRQRLAQPEVPVGNWFRQTSTIPILLLELLCQSVALPFKIYNIGGYFGQGNMQAGTENGNEIWL